MNGETLKNLILTALSNIAKTGVKCKALVCDGLAANKSMASQLEIDMGAESEKMYFEHQGNTVFFIMDAYHMIKLLRNLWSDCRILVNSRDGSQIKWEYIEKLHSLQMKEGLRASNKLRSSHFNWKTQKMKVKLVVQVFSSSVAKALEYCRETNQLEIEECDGAVKFLSIIDRMFDYTNSRNVKAKGFKAPMCRETLGSVKHFFSEAMPTLAALGYQDGTKVIHTHRKTPLFGLINSMEAILGFADELLVSDGSTGMRFLLTYKLSQDHLELFSSCIRSSGGFNDNPPLHINSEMLLEE